jgi:subtilase family serine protease
MPFYAYGPRKNTRLTNLLISNTFATVQAKPRIDAGTPTATPNPVTTTNPQSSLTAPITASTVGLEQGDFAVVEVINDTAGGTVTYADGPVKNVPLVLGGTTTVTFNVTSATVGSHTLRVRIADIMRPNPNGPPTSILSRTAVDPNGKTTIFTVNP